MPDLYPSSVIAGSCILLVIALLPVRKDSGRRLAFLGFIAGTLLAICAVNLLLSLGDFVVDGGDEHVVKAQVDRVQADAAAGHVPKNLVVIEGSSQTALGLDSQQVQDELRSQGYDVTVLDFSMAGGNLLERYTLEQRFVQEMRRRGLRYSPNTQLLFELHAAYDQDPLRFFSGYEDTLQTYYYSHFDNLAFTLQDYWQRGHKLDKPTLDNLGDFLSHCFVWDLHIGFLPQVSRFDDLQAVQAFTPSPVPEPRYHFHNYGPDIGDYVPGRRKRPIPAEQIQERVQRVVALYGGAASGYGFFSVPSLARDRMHYGREVCGLRLAPVCIDPSDPALYGSLDNAAYYYNRDHLTTRGARIYSHWFAQQLVAQGVVIK